MLVLDVVFKFFAIILDEGANRHRRGIAQCANRATLDIVGNRIQHVQIINPAMAVLDAMDHAVQPASTFAARRTLAAGFLEVEIRETQQGLDHAARLIHHYHGTGTEHRSRFRD